MATEIIGKWEFEHAAQGELRYRMTQSATIVNVLAATLFTVAFAFLTVVVLVNKESDVHKNRFVWAGGFGLATLGAAAVIAGQVRLRTVDHALSPRRDHYRHGDKVICRLSDIRDVCATRTEIHSAGGAGEGSSRRISYSVRLSLMDGGSIITNLGEGEEKTVAQAEQLRGAIAAVNPAVKLRCVGF